MTVALVGAGPGDPGLITVRGLELLRACDAVVYDRLVASELVDETPDDALRIPRDGIAQEQINELLVALGRQGLDVVRLKGGDPYLFGRGGEEALALAEAGVPFEVVPGVSSLAAVPAAARAEAEGSASSPFLLERFDAPGFPPAGWTVIDNGGSGVVWSNVAGSLEAGNFTGGAGDAASVSSDLVGVAEFDTELRSPQFSLPAATPVGLHFLANYQNFNGFDFLDVEFSTDGGTVWNNLLSWNENHGTFRDVPGECVNVDLSAHAGSPRLAARPDATSSAL